MLHTIPTAVVTQIVARPGAARSITSCAPMSPVNASFSMMRNPRTVPVIPRPMSRSLMNQQASAWGSSSLLTERRSCAWYVSQPIKALADTSAIKQTMLSLVTSTTQSFCAIPVTNSAARPPSCATAMNHHLSMTMSVRSSLRRRRFQKSCCGAIVRDESDSRHAVSQQRFNACCAPLHPKPLTSANDFNDGHHAFVFVVRGVAVIDEASDDHRVREGDHDLQCARRLVCRRRCRARIAQALFGSRDAVDFRDEKRSLMNMEAVILLVGVDDRPFLGVAQLHCLIDAV